MADRSITAGVLAEVTAPSFYPAIFIELDFSSGFSRLWTGSGDITWDTKTWNGAGQVGKISKVEETQRSIASGISFQLSGIDPANLSIALSEYYQGRSAKVWLGFLDANGDVIPDPIGPFAYRMDTMEIDKGADTSTITINAENELIDLKKPRIRRYTDQDQQIEYAGDKGFEYVAGLQDKSINWGKS